MGKRDYPSSATDSGECYPFHAHLDHVPTDHGPDALGVPVAIRSPGSSVMTARCTEAQHRSENEVARVTRPGGPLHVTLVCTPTPAQGSISSVTTGPTGQNVSNPLARVHWPSLFCRSRAVKSSTQV